MEKLTLVLIFSYTFTIDKIYFYRFLIYIFHYNLVTLRFYLRFCDSNNVQSHCIFLIGVKFETDTVQRPAPKRLKRYGN